MKLILVSLIASAAAFAPAPATFVRTALSAEWTPPAGSKWVEKDFEKDIKKLEKEAEERLEKKIAELKANIATVGKP